MRIELRSYKYALTCLVFAACLGTPETATADQFQLDTEASLLTTYVFRGVPQYTTEEIPSLQFRARGEFHWPRSFGWIELWEASALDRRKANSQLGTADELDISTGYTFDVDKDKSLTFGAIAYLRPQNDPVDVREEAIARFNWRVRDSEEWRLVPYFALYGEFHRMLGVYGELGVDLERALGQGFFLGLGLKGGLSYYVESDEEFNAVTTRIALIYTFLDHWAVSGHFNGSITTDVNEFDTEFVEEHGVFWSGFSVRYRHSFPR